MTREEVVELMKSSNSEREWNANCDKVKAACQGYPPYWYEAILGSGLAADTMARFGASPDIKIKTL